MSWAFQPLLPAASHQQSDPNGVSSENAATAEAAHDAIVIRAAAVTESGSAASSAISPVAGSKSMLCGGLNNSSSPQTLVDGVQFSNDSYVTYAAALSIGMYRSASVSDTNFGYLIAGVNYWHTRLSTTDKADFLSESFSAISATLAVENMWSACVKSATKAYRMGGQNVSDAPVDTIESLTFSTDAVASVSATLGVAKSGGMGTNSATKGYIAHYGTATPNTEALLFSNETVATISTFTTSPYSSPTGAGESALVGLWCSGMNANDLTHTNSSWSMAFSNETAQNIAGSITPARKGGAAQSAQHVYCAGGFNASGASASISRVSKVNAAGSALGISLSVARSELAGLSYNPSQVLSESRTEAATAGSAHGVSHLLSVAGAGYFCGISGDLISGVNFNNSTTRAVAATLLGTYLTAKASVSSDIKGYLAGGESGGVSVTDSIQSLSFIVDSVASSSAVLSVARSRHVGVCTIQKGYFAGGMSSGVSSDIDGLIYANETAINPSAVLATPRMLMSSASSPTRGYWAGGEPIASTYSDEVEALNFSDETALNPSAVLSMTKSTGGSWQTPDYGYFFGGFNGTVAFSHDIDRLAYATETMSTLSETLVAFVSSPTGVSSLTTGYNTTSDVNIDSFDFATETTGTTSAAVAIQYSSSVPVFFSYSSITVSYQGVTETASAAATATKLLLIAKAATEAATASSAHPATATFVALGSEQATGDSVQSCAGSVGSEQAESSPAIAAPGSALSSSAERAEAGSAEDAATGSALFVSTETAPAIATDTTASTQAANAETTESAVAGSIQSALAAFVAELTELVAATGDGSAVAVLAAEQSESGAAQVVGLATVVYPVALVSTAAAADASTGDTTGSIHFAGSEESLVAMAEQSALMVAAVSHNAAGAALAQGTAQAVIYVVAGEDVEALAVADAYAAFVVYAPTATNAVASVSAVGSFTAFAQEIVTALSLASLDREAEQPIITAVVHVLSLPGKAFVVTTQDKAVAASAVEQAAIFKPEGR